MAHQLLTETSGWVAIHQKLNQEMSYFLEQSVSSGVAVLSGHRQFLGRDSTMVHPQTKLHAAREVSIYLSPEEEDLGDIP